MEICNPQNAAAVRKLEVLHGSVGGNSPSSYLGYPPEQTGQEVYLSSSQVHARTGLRGSVLFRSMP